MSACRLQEEPSRLDLQEEPERRGLMGLPPELLVMVLARVPLRDLAKLRQVGGGELPPAEQLFSPLPSSSRVADILVSVRGLPLSPLSQVCRRLRDMVDGPGGRRLWAAASLEGLAVDSTRLPLIERCLYCISIYMVADYPVGIYLCYINAIFLQSG